MLVQEQMTAAPLTVQLGTTVPDALALMRDKKVRRLPVVDKAGKLAGIVSDKDLLYASASPTTTLSIWEINSLLAKLVVDRYMTKKVVTVTETTPLEDAARIMADKKIGGLPVMRGDTLVGIITETDIFRSLLELLGGRRKGVRVTAKVEGGKGSFAKVVNAIAAAGGDIVGLGCAEVKESGIIHWQLTMKIQDVGKTELEKALKPVVLELTDVREATV